MRRTKQRRGGRMPSRANSDARVLLRLNRLAVASLCCTVIIFVFMVVASVQAVSMIDRAAAAREQVQVTRAIAAQTVPLNEITLAAIADTLDLDHARLTFAGELQPTELSVPIGGDRVAAWQPHSPGKATFEIVAPLRIGAGIGFVLIVAVLGWRIRAAALVLERGRAQAEELASTDALTGLGNRLAFDIELDARLAASAKGGPGPVLLLADLDRLKSINDRFGHSAGDLALQFVGRQLHGAAREGDFVARLGGDEFAVIHTGRALDELIADIQWRLASPLAIDGESLTVGASIGMARSEDFPGPRPTLYKAADAALYRAKHRGSGSTEIAVPPVAA